MREARKFLAERNPLTITEQQARAIAYLLHEIRPDWGITSIVSLIDKHGDVDLGPLIIAATTKAMEATCLTPAPIFHPGNHWPAKAKAKLPKPAPCEDHIGQDAHNCRSCWGDHKAGLRPQDKIGRHYTPQAEMEDA